MPVRPRPLAPATPMQGGYRANGAAPPGAMLSPDGQWWWNGAAWVPNRGRSFWTSPGGIALYVIGAFVLLVVFLIVLAVIGAQVDQVNSNVFSNIADGLNQ